MKNGRQFIEVVDALDTVEIVAVVELERLKNGTCKGGADTKVKEMLLQAEGVNRLQYMLLIRIGTQAYCPFPDTIQTSQKY